MSKLVLIKGFPAILGANGMSALRARSGRGLLDRLVDRGLSFGTVRPIGGNATIAVWAHAIPSPVLIFLVKAPRLRCQNPRCP